MITRCPKCGTTFKISSEQLSAAGGAVRCGACLTVFNGQDHLSSDNESRSDVDSHATLSSVAANDIEPPEQSSITFEEPAEVETSSSDDDVMIHDDMESEPDEDQDINITFADTVEGGFDNLEISANPHASSSDESWAEELLAELEDDDIDDPLDPMRAFDPQDNTAPIDAPSQPAPTYSRENPSPVAPRSVTETPVIDAPSARLAYFEEEPLELEQGTPKSVRIKRFMSVLLVCLLATAALGAQIATHKFQTLALDDRFRPSYAAVCSIIGCALPKQEDLSKIRVTHTSIKHDSNNKQILIIELMIKNTAHFKQPYPDLNVYFDNSVDETVASRHLKPSEYLKGAMSGSTRMPVNQPVRIKIGILDPGEDALYPKVLVAQ